MTSAARAASSAPVRFVLSVASGPDAGAAYELLPPRTTIGRGPGNDVLLSDPKCSRSQAIIEFGPAGPFVRDISERSPMSVNGEATKQINLNDSDVIRVGQSDLIFKISQASSPQPQASKSPAHGASRALELTSTRSYVGHAASAPGVPNYPPLAVDPGLGPFAGPYSGASPGPGGRRPPLRTTQASTGMSPRMRFYLIVGIVGLAIAWLATSSPKDRLKDPGIRTTDKIDSELAEAGTRVEALRKKRDMGIEERSRFLEADRHYHDGFRDLQDGQFDRAAKSFETALAIDPRHEMAQFYQKQALRLRDESIDAWMKEGRGYRERDMYVRCVAALDKVIKAIASPQDARRRESQALRDECDALSGAEK